MSFILDALRKAERDRDVGKAPSLQDVARAPESAPQIQSSRTLSHGLLIGGLLLLIALGLFLALRWKAPPPPSAESRPAGHVTATVRGPAPVYAPGETPAAAATDAPIDDGQPAIEDGESLATLDDLTAAPRPAEAEAPASAVAEPAQVTIRRDDFVVRPDPAPITRAPALAPEPIAPAPRSLSALEAPLGTEARQPAASSASSQGASNARPLDTMPSAYQASFPVLSVEVHVWDSEPAKRFVLVGGRRYREGDALAAGPRLTTITQDGIELEYQDERVLYPLNR